MTMGPEFSILGMSIMNATPQELASMHAALYAALDTGILRPVISQEMPLSQAPRAHRLLKEGGEAHGKIVLVPRESEA
jgi:NADPH:quinone reductase-like Zn-dependent oxidoreductase